MEFLSPEIIDPRSAARQGPRTIRASRCANSRAAV